MVRCVVFSTLPLLACLGARLDAATQAPPPVEPDALAAALGAKVFAENCNRCHLAPSPVLHSAQGWIAISLHMRVFGDLSRTDQRRVLQFLRTFNTAMMHRTAGTPASR